MSAPEQGVETYEAHWVFGGEGFRHIRVIHEPAQVEGPQEIDESASDSTEADHGNFAADERLRRAMQVNVLINAI